MLHWLRSGLLLKAVVNAGCCSGGPLPAAPAESSATTGAGAVSAFIRATRPR